MQENISFSSVRALRVPVYTVYTPYTFGSPLTDTYGYSLRHIATLALALFRAALNEVMSGYFFGFFVFIQYTVSCSAKLQHHRSASVMRFVAIGLVMVLWWGLGHGTSRWSVSFQSTGPSPIEEDRGRVQESARNFECIQSLTSQ